MFPLKATELKNFGLVSFAKIIDFVFLKELHEKLVNPKMSEYMTWYLDRPEKWRVVKIHMPENLKRKNYRVTVDTEMDLKVVKKVYDSLYKGIPIKKIVFK